MAYTREIRLKRIIAVQNITARYRAKGVGKRYIYDNYIAPVYDISLSTFYNYLHTKAKKQLKELQSAKRRTNRL